MQSRRSFILPYVSFISTATPVGIDSNMLRRPNYLSRVDYVRKIRDRKQRTDIGKYLFVNGTIKNWNQLPAEALGTFPCKPKTFRKRVIKALINGVKGKGKKCVENRLKVQ